MEHAKRLYLVDEFDRVYKQLQRPSAAVAKTHSSIQLSKTLQDNQLSEDEKVRRYVAELHRYLNISDSHTQQQQQQQQQTVKKSRKRPLNVNTDRPILAVRRRLRQQRSKKFQGPKLSHTRNHPSRKYANSTCQTGPHTSNELIHTTYTTPSEPGSFSAVQNLKRYTGESYKNINRYLSDQDAYTLHKQRRIHFPRRKTYSKGIGDLYQADLVDLSNISVRALRACRTRFGCQEFDNVFCRCSADFCVQFLHVDPPRHSVLEAVRFHDFGR